MELGTIKISWNTNFTMIPNELWDIENLSHEGFRIFTYLIRLGANKEGEAFPSYPTMASKCQILNGKDEFCKTKTRRIIEELINKGLVKKFNRKKKGTSKFGSNLYILTHPKELLNLDKTSLKDEYDIITDTPCVTTKKEYSKKPNEINEKKFDTPVSLVKSMGTEPKMKKSDTYIDLHNNTYLNKDDDRSIVEDLENKKDQTELLKNCYELISKATGLNQERVKMCISPNLFWKIDLQELVLSFAKSKYLQGVADKKVPISTFGSIVQLKKVIGGFYEDRPEGKTKGKVAYKLPKTPDVIRVQEENRNKTKQKEAPISDIEKLKGELSNKLIKLGKIKEIGVLAPLRTLIQIEKFRKEYSL